MQVPTTVIKLAELLAPLVSITTSTAILSYSIFLAPVLISESTHHSPVTALHQLRPYFEQGKYVFPPLSVICTALFGILAYAHPAKRLGFSIAAAGSVSILPFTSLYMIPYTNNRILDLDDEGHKDPKAVDRQEEDVKVYLAKFIRENYVRGGMFWIGGVVGLWTVLA
ncbi:hypothetical protein BCR39DRAFT_558309 [Naematelia encephala]|uniref:DUF1772-domain-containing protein n=1 Tax=Naematelia encephala TaxID=71784 RepID=A0A1Y2B8Y4_9TREE|nr:hypothetical protein BCR39DRAFT_558309 [Naematelia encephala]